jgi:hypothetical protein
VTPSEHTPGGTSVLNVRETEKTGHDRHRADRLEMDDGPVFCQLVDCGQQGDKEQDTHGRLPATAATGHTPFHLGLTLNASGGEGQYRKTLLADQLAAHIADTVGAFFD